MPCGVLPKDALHNGAGYRINFKAFVRPLAQPKHSPTQRLPLERRIIVAAFDVLRQIGRIVFGETLHHRFEHDPLWPVWDAFLRIQEPDTVLLQLGLVDGAVISRSGKAVIFPCDHDVELALAAVTDHSLEFRASIGRAGHGAVAVFLNDSDVVPLGKRMAVAQLAFNAFVALARRRIPGIDYADLFLHDLLILSQNRITSLFVEPFYYCAI